MRLSALLTTLSLLGCYSHHRVEAGDGPADGGVLECRMDVPERPGEPLTDTCSIYFRPAELEVCLPAQVVVGERWPDIEVTVPEYPCDGLTGSYGTSGAPPPDLHPDVDDPEEADFVVDVAYQRCVGLFDEWCACHPEPFRSTQTVWLSPPVWGTEDWVIRRVGTRSVGVVVGHRGPVLEAVPYAPIPTFDAVRERTTDAQRCFTLRPDS